MQQHVHGRNFQIDAIHNQASVVPEPAGFLVRVTTNGLNIRPEPSTRLSPVGIITDRGVYTIVEVQGEWGRLKSGVGWINLRYTERLNNTSAHQPARKTNEQIAAEVWDGEWGNGADRERRLREAGYDPAIIQRLVNQGVGR